MKSRCNANERIAAYQFLRRIHVETRPNSYLEIGVETGATLNLATCPAVGVDPAPLQGRSPARTSSCSR